MNHLTLFSILWSLAICVGSAQEVATPKEESSPAIPAGFGGKAEPATDTASSAIAAKIAELRTDYETANKQARDLDESFRQTPDAAKKAKLRTAVQRAFTLRQSLLRAELLEMQTRLLQTQQSLDMRERIADQIVDRRVDNLLNPQLKWEQGLSGERKIKSELKPQKPAESSIAEDSLAITELEGDWHLVSITDKAGDPMEVRPVNLSFRNAGFSCKIPKRGARFATK